MHILPCNSHQATVGQPQVNESPCDLSVTLVPKKSCENQIKTHQ